MVSSFLKITVRNLYNEKRYAVINIAGLSLAIACCLILGLYLHTELTYDRHNPKHRQIYRVVNEFNINGKSERMARTSQLLGPILKDEYSDVKDYVRFFTVSQKSLIRSDDKAFYWKNETYANKEVFDYFKHEFIYGDPKTVKTGRFFAVSETFAKKYWGDENPIGKTVKDENGVNIITHVFADLPPNSHLKYDVLASDDIPFFDVPENANARLSRLVRQINYYTYLIMDDDYDIRNFKDISDSFNKKNMEIVLRGSNVTWKAWLQPLADIHYYSDVDIDETTGNLTYLYGFTAVAIFILLVACINYMNLATARAAKRAKEIGMHKILGSGRVRLIFRFMGAISSRIFILAIVLGPNTCRVNH